jgi:hypothetical protein
MYKGLKEYYDACGFRHVIVLNIDWEKEDRGNKEYTIEEIACMQEGKFYHMKVKMEYGSGWTIERRRFYILNRKEISPEKFELFKSHDLTKK